jgi:hypothetical protein
MRWRLVVALFASAAVAGGVAMATTGGSGRPPAGLVLHADVGIGTVEVGERRRDVTRDLGVGRARTTPASSYGLGACSFGFCRAYRVDGSIVAVDFDRQSRRVVDVLTQSRGLTVEGHHPSDGFRATRRALQDWHVLRCSGGGWIMFHTKPPNGPTSTLVFEGEPFGQAAVSARSPPSGCFVAANEGSRLTSDPWVVLEAGPRSRSLVIQYHAACGVSAGRPIVTETNSTISIRVAQSIPRNPAGCFRGPLLTPNATVELKSRIAGRRITGTGFHLTTGVLGVPISLSKPTDDVIYLSENQRFRAVRPEVPSVLGLAPRQAIFTLALQGFRGKIIGHGQQVTGQDPTRGHVPRGNRACCSAFAGDVTLTTGP